MAGSNYEQAVRHAVNWMSAAENCAPRGAERHETLAFAVHALLLNHGFRCAGVPVFEHEEQMKTLRGVKLQEEWGRAGYGGKYCHSRSSLTFEVRMVPLGASLMCHGAVLEDEREIHTLQLSVDRYVLGGREYEQSVQAPDANWNDAASWAPLFLNVAELAAVVQINLAQKLVPDSSKDGYADYAAERQSSAQAGAAPGSSRSNTSESMRRPERPRFEPVPGPVADDPLRIGPPMRARAPPFGVGGDDLYAPGMPQFPSLPGGFPGIPDRGGGNLVGPRHPGFGDGGRYSGGAGMMPGTGVPRPPPGARFDPFGPPGTGLGEPDNDLMMPPGMHGPPSGGTGQFPPPPGGPPPDMYW